MKSASSLKAVSLAEKLRQGAALAYMHLQRNRAQLFGDFDESVSEYGQFYRDMADPRSVNPRCLRSDSEPDRFDLFGSTTRESMFGELI